MKVDNRNNKNLKNRSYIRRVAEIGRQAALERERVCQNLESEKLAKARQRDFHAHVEKQLRMIRKNFPREFGQFPCCQKLKERHWGKLITGVKKTELENRF